MDANNSNGVGGGGFFTGNGMNVGISAAFLQPSLPSPCGFDSRTRQKFWHV